MYKKIPFLFVFVGFIGILNVQSASATTKNCRAKEPSAFVVMPEPTECQVPNSSRIKNNRRFGKVKDLISIVSKENPGKNPS